MINKYIEQINDNTSFILINGETIIKDKGNGVKPIINIINNNKSLLNNSIVIDKIIGKAAALLLTKYKVKQVSSLIMSQSAIDIFLSYGIEYSYKTLVANILNRSNTGLCPLEDVVKDTNDIEVAEELIRNRINELMSHG